MNSNPYSPPGAYGPPQPMGGGGWGAPAFVPVGWRTTLGAIAIGANCVTSFALDGTQLAFAKDLGGDDPALGPSLILGVAGLAVLFSQILAIVFFSMFIHRAATNVRALGRTGMEYTPGWCVGWYFIPFANLVRPYRAMSEVWRASDPDAGAGPDWMASPSVPGFFPLWWGTWLVSSVLANVSARIDDPSSSGAIGLAGSVVSAIAGAVCISMMFKLAQRQSAAAARSSAPAPYASPYANAPYGAPQYGP